MAKTLLGKVISVKMEKTVVVAVESRKVHPLYGKAVKKIKNYKAHVENTELKEGDAVKIYQTKPISKDKKWKVLEKVN